MFVSRFRERLAHLIGSDGGGVLLACSGGLDSVVLLYLLRFHAGDLTAEVSAAHLDHAMRPTSEADADWVAGLCAAWGVPLLRERLGQAPKSEADARSQRYRFLQRIRQQTGADWIATAHHADDQAETVLFRVVRGTGLDGLRGIPEKNEERRLIRPLLPCWRKEVAAFARHVGLRWREDESNQYGAPARNRLRHQILPALERHVAAGTRANLVRLAAAAAEEADRIDRRVRTALFDVAEQNGAFLLARSTFRGYDSPTAAGLLRHVLKQFGVVLDRAGTRSAVQFISEAASGRELHLPRGVRVLAEFDVAKVVRAEANPPDEPLAIAGLVSGVLPGNARIGGRRYSARAEWFTAARETEQPPAGTVLLDPDLKFPLRLRGWQPGDRMRSGGHTRTLKALFGERRVPRSARRAVPVLVDADNTVLWVVDLARADAAAPQTGRPAFLLQVIDDADL